MSRKREAETETVVDMTPMIDLTFLLIIFFIIVNDMSKKELEELKLPIAKMAGHDEPPKTRPILNVRWFPAGGVPTYVIEQYAAMGVGVPSDEEWSDIVWKGRLLYWPNKDPKGRTDPIRKGRPDYYWELETTAVDEWLPNFSKEFDATLKKDLPDDPILIRADRNTPFKYIQKIMEVCTREDVLIWRVQLAASETPEAIAAREAAEGN
jgi:biopolymer transport protein ExbD